MPVYANPSRAWDQIPGESAEDFEAFQAYLGGSSMAEVSAQIGRMAGPIGARNRWVARREAYLAALSEATTQGALARARDIGAEHAELAANLRSKAYQDLLELQAKGELSPRELIKLLEISVTWERLDRGASTGRIDVDFSGKTDKELEALEALLRPEVQSTH